MQVGATFGLWTALGPERVSASHHVELLVRCQCGVEGWREKAKLERRKRPACLKCSRKSRECAEAYARTYARVTRMQHIARLAKSIAAPCDALDLAIALERSLREIGGHA